MRVTHPPELAERPGEGRSVGQDGAVPRLGTCYGFEVISDLSFEYLRDGSGDPLLVEEAAASSFVTTGDPIKSWDPVPGKRSLTQLFRENGSFFVEIGGSHRFRVDPGAGRIRMCASQELRQRELLLWTTPAAIGVTLRGDVAIHAAAVEIAGRAVLLISPSGYGKSTLAAAFFRRGYRVLADDFGCCRAGVEPVVFPGPALLRVSRDVASRLECADTYCAYEGSTKLHLAMAPSRRGDAEPVPLAGIVFLRHSSDAVALEPVPAKIALRDLWAMSFHLPGEGEMARYFRDLADLLARVPAWNLSRDLKWHALDAAVERIVDEVTAE